MDTPAIPASSTLLSFEGTLGSDEAEGLLLSMRGMADKGQISRAAFRVFVELLQNVRLHGCGACSLNVWHENGLLHIETRNEASESDIGRAKERVEEANLNNERLSAIIHERRLLPHSENECGAGLGLFEIRRLGATDLQIATQEAKDAKSVLVIRASVEHKSLLVTDLQLQATSTTPRVSLPSEGNEAWIEGNCYPENAFSFFEPILSWLRNYRADGGKKMRLNVKLDYFNTSSSKCLLDLFQILQEANAEGASFSVCWLYCEDDPDMRENGEEFAQDLKLPFEIRAY